MPLLFLLFLLFVVLPLGELALLFYLAGVTHWTVPLAVVIGTGLLGMLMIRLQGWRTAAAIRAKLQAGEAPTDPLLDAGLLLFAAGLLLTPGVLTDLTGLSLLFPATRALWRRQIKRSFRDRFQVRWTNGAPGGGPAESDILDGDVVGREDDDQESREINSY